MSSTGENTTTPPSSDELVASHRAARAVHGFVIAWSVAQPHRVGEIALLPHAERSWTLGRGAEEDGGPRVRFGRQRPGAFTETGPLVGDALSRRQLRVERRGIGLLLWSAMAATTDTTLKLTDELRVVAEAEVDVETDSLVAGIGRTYSPAEVRACLVRHRWNKGDDALVRRGTLPPSDRTKRSESRKEGPPSRSERSPERAVQPPVQTIHQGKGHA